MNPWDGVIGSYANSMRILGDSDTHVGRHAMVQVAYGGRCCVEVDGPSSGRAIDHGMIRAAVCWIRRGHTVDDVETLIVD